MRSALAAAHRGYEYQDLMVAARSVDLLLGTLHSAIVDVKLFKDDRFDDLTIVDIEGRRERVQFKHTDREGQALSIATFTSDSRQLKLDKLLAAAIADRDGPGSAATSLSFRVLLRDSRPTSDPLVSYLKPASDDPGPFLPEMNSFRMQLDIDEIWPDQGQNGQEFDLFLTPLAFIRDVPGVDRADFAWFCQRLVIEVEAPAMSGDLGNPGDTEALLLDRVVQELGAGQFPNVHRAPIDVCAALVSTARMARQGHTQLSVGELLARIIHGAGSGSPSDPTTVVRDGWRRGGGGPDHGAATPDRRS